MRARSPRLLPTAAVLAALAAFAPPAAPPALAADNVPSSKWYENKLIGFRFRPLNEWGEIPQGTDTDDPKICGFYSDAAKFDRRTRPECKVYAFKVQSGAGVATPGSGGGGTGGAPPANEDEAREALLAQMRWKSTREAVETLRSRYTTMADQFLARFDEKKRKKVLKDLEIKEPVEKEQSVGDLKFTTLEFNVGLPLVNGEVIQGKVFAGWTQNEEYEVGLIYEVPGDQWKKYGKGVMQSTFSLQFLDGDEVAAAREDLAEALAGKSDDERWLETIKRKVVPGWSHRQTRNYLVVYDKDVKPARIEMIARQIEAIRKDVYEVLFPADRPITAVSVVRVCKDKDQYHQYGGPQGSAGYWNWAEQELVFYEDISAKKDTLRVLYHEAFHQYIFYSVGNVSPHSWFNEGHGDYFSGHNLNNNGKFVPKPFSWRTGVIKASLGSKTYVPLKQFVTYDQRAYYANGGPNYAQGWSLVWFLRQQRDPQWKGILEAYFDALKGVVTKWAKEEEEKARKEGTWKEGWTPGLTPDAIEKQACEAGLEAAFGGWDEKKWEKFERAWKDFL